MKGRHNKQDKKIYKKVEEYQDKSNNRFICMQDKTKKIELKFTWPDRSNQWQASSIPNMLQRAGAIGHACANVCYTCAPK